MDERSGLFQAGTILLLVGAIMSVFGALMMIAFVVGFGMFFAALEPEVGGLPEWMSVFYGAMALLMAGGAAAGFAAFAKARQGDAAMAFTFGLVCALLPPLQVVPLIGAILCKVSPEAQSP